MALGKYKLALKDYEGESPKWTKIPYREKKLYRYGP